MIYVTLPVVCLAVLLSCAALAAPAPNAFPPLPKVANGVNQIGVKDPLLTDAELERLKREGANTYRFPLWPREVGLDDKAVASWENGEVWDEKAADEWPVDWTALDLLLDKLARHGLTPYICPHPDPPSPRSWAILHVPEAAQRALWFTKLIVKHVHAKYGDNVIYGWFEDIYWLSYTRTLGPRFPGEWRGKLSQMYGGKIASLNRAWKSEYASFGDVPVPELWLKDAVPESAYESRRTYDLRLGMDLMQRECLKKWRAELRRISPGAMWAGGCLHNGFEGMYDARLAKPLRNNPSILTHAMTSDVLAVDMYRSPEPLSVQYRTVAKIAASQGKKYYPVELQAQHIPSFEALAKVGGPVYGALVWEGKERENMFSLFMYDGTPREDFIKATSELFKAFRTLPETYSVYRPGRVHVYYPEGTYEYMVLRSSHLDAYDHVCDKLPAADLEPVLTSELGKLPKDVPIFVLEKHLPRKAIDALNKLGQRVICPHPFFVDESGNRVARKYVPKDFYRELRAAQDGPALLEAFSRVEEKEHNLAYADLGATIQTTAELAPKNSVWTDRDNKVDHAIDGDFIGFTFASKAQPEVLDVHLPEPKNIRGAFVQLYPGDTCNAPSRIPSRFRVLVSSDGQQWKEVASLTDITSARIRVRFRECTAAHVRLDLGENTGGAGLIITDVGVLSK